MAYSMGPALLLGLLLCLIGLALTQRSADPAAFQRAAEQLRHALAPMLSASPAHILGVAIGAVTVLFVIVPLGLIMIAANTIGSVFRAAIVGMRHAR